MSGAMRRIIGLVSAGLVTAVWVMGFKAQAVAPPPSNLSCNSHSVARTTVKQRGGYMSAVTVNMNANYTPYTGKVILKSLWDEVDPYGSWIEVGFMDGFLKGSNYHGFYTAYGEYDSLGHWIDYDEFPVTGSSTTPGLTHNYEVQYVGNNLWRAYVDFTSVHDYTFYSDFGYTVDVGWETAANNAPYRDFTYDSPNYSTAHEYLDYQTGAWMNWSNGSVEYTNGCDNTLYTPNVYWNPAYTGARFEHP